MRLRYLVPCFLFLLLFKRIPLSTAPCMSQAIIYEKLFVVSYSHFLLTISQNKIIFYRFVSIDLGCLSAYLSTDLFLSTSTSYLGSWSRNPSVPGYLQISVAGSLMFDLGSSSLAPGRMILRVFNFNSFYSHSLDCIVHLRDHHHYRWPPSRLLTVFIIDW